MLRRKALATPAGIGAGYTENAYTHADETSGAPTYNIRPQLLLLLAGIGALIGPFLPWISVQIDNTTVSQAGIDFSSDSAWCAVAIGASVLAAVVFNFVKRRVAGFAEVLGALVLALVLGGIDLNGFDQVGRLAENANGLGLYCMLGAAFALAVGGIWQAYVIGRGRITLIITGVTLVVLLIAGIAIALVPSSSTSQAPALGPAGGVTAVSGTSSSPATPHP